MKARDLVKTLFVNGLRLEVETAKTRTIYTTKILFNKRKKLFYDKNVKSIFVLLTSAF